MERKKFGKRQLEEGAWDLKQTNGQSHGVKKGILSRRSRGPSLHKTWERKKKEFGKV